MDIPGWGEKLSPDLFIKQTKPRKELVVGTEGGITLALDTKLDENLIIEGMARDIIRQCQVLRKDANFMVEQRITVCFKATDPLLLKTIDTFAEHIKEEILAREIVNEMISPHMTREVTLGNAKLTLSIAPFNTQEKTDG